MCSLSSRLRGAERHPLHHHAARREVVAPGLVVLERRDDRHARALDRRRRVGHDDVEALVASSRWLRPSATTSRPSGSARTCRRRRRSSSRTSAGPTARAPRTSVRRPAISDDRNAVPMPNATTSARSESGRAMSGRIGMSLASTVSSVIDVPPTHSSGVDDFWPAWTEAISSSSRLEDLPPSDSMSVTFGCAMAPGRAARNTDDDDEARPRRVGQPTRTRSTPAQASPTPSVAFDERQHDDDRRRADRRHEDERDDEAAEDGPGRVRRRAARPTRNRPRRARRAGAPRRSGSAMPRTIVTGRTIGDRRRRTARGPRPQRSPGSSGARLRDHEEQTERREDRDRQLRDREDPDRVLVMRGRRRVKSTAPIAIPTRNSARMTVNT